MDKEAIVNKTVETLTPFETANIVDFVKHLTVQKAIASPWIIGIFLVVTFYAVIVRSKFVLSVLFTVISLMLLIRYTIPAESGEGVSLSSTLPFAFGGVAIGAVLIYLNFIKSE